MRIYKFNNKEKLVIHHEVLKCCNDDNSVELSLDICTFKPLTICNRHSLEKLICQMVDVLELNDDN